MGDYERVQNEIDGYDCDAWRTTEYLDALDRTPLHLVPAEEEDNYPNQPELDPRQIGWNKLRKTLGGLTIRDPLDDDYRIGR